MNLGDYGVQFVFDAGFDLSAFTSMVLEFFKPSGLVLSVTPALGTTTLNTAEQGPIPANTYVTYTFQTGDVNETGAWRARLVYTDASPLHLTSDAETFAVGPVN